MASIPTPWWCWVQKAPVSTDFSASQRGCQPWSTRATPQSAHTYLIPLDCLPGWDLREGMHLGKHSEAITALIAAQCLQIPMIEECASSVHDGVVQMADSLLKCAAAVTCMYGQGEIHLPPYVAELLVKSLPFSDKCEPEAKIAPPVPTIQFLSRSDGASPTMRASLSVKFDCCTSRAPFIQNTAPPRGDTFLVKLHEPTTIVVSLPQHAPPP